MEDNQGWTVVTRKKPTKPKEKKKPQGPVTESYNQAANYPSFGGHQDWKDIKFQKRRTQSSKEHPKERRPRQYVVNDQQRRMFKLDQAEDVGRVKLVKPELSKKIQEYRRLNKLTQVELAQQLNLKTEVISSYEKGTAVHNPAITSKFYRLFQMKKRAQTSEASNAK